MSRDLFSPFPRLRRAVYASAFIIVPLIPLGIARLGAYAIAHMAWWCDRRGRMVVEENLRPVMLTASNQAIRRSVRHAYINCLYSIAENLHLHQLPHTIASREACRVIDPWHALKNPPLRGPKIMVTLHANFEIFPALLRKLGIIDSVHAVTLSHEDPKIDRMFDRARQAAGITSLLLDKAPLASLRALHEGQIIGIVGDRDYTSNGVAAPFFGRQILLPPGPAALAVQTNAQILPMFCARRGHTRFEIFAGRPLTVDPTLSKRDQIKAVNRALAAWYERCIAAVPSQWLAFHPIWPKAAH